MQLQVGAVYILLLFLVSNDFCQTCHLIIYQTDGHLMFRVGRSVAIDDQFESSFSMPEGTSPRQPIFWVLSTQISSGDIWWYAAYGKSSSVVSLDAGG